MEIELLIDYEKIKFIKENRIDVRNHKCEILIDDNEYNCVYENYSISSSEDVRIKLKKSYSKITIENIILSFKQIKALTKYTKIKFNGMQWYVNLEITNLKGNNNCKIQKLQFIEY